MTPSEMDFYILDRENTLDKRATIERCILFYNSPCLAYKDYVSPKDAVFSEIEGLIERIEKREKEFLERRGNSK